MIFNLSTNHSLHKKFVKIIVKLFVTQIFWVMQLDTDLGVSSVFQNKIREFNMAHGGNILFFFQNFPSTIHSRLRRILFGSKHWIDHKIIEVSNTLVNVKNRYMHKISTEQEWYSAASIVSSTTPLVPSASPPPDLPTSTSGMTDIFHDLELISWLILLV